MTEKDSLIGNFLTENKLTLNDLFTYIRNYLSAGTMNRAISITKTKIDEAYLWYNSNLG